MQRNGDGHASVTEPGLYGANGGNLFIKRAVLTLFATNKKEVITFRLPAIFLCDEVATKKEFT